MSNNQVRYGIGSASYNDSGTADQVNEKILSQVLDERRRGNKYQNALLLRSHQNPDLLKFNLQVGGLPIFVRSYDSMCNAGLEKVVLVGNRDAQKIHDAYCSFFNINNSEFVYEGSPDSWSRSNTILRAFERLNATDTDLVIETALDTPYIDVSAIKNDTDAQKSDFLIRLNARKVTGEFFPRNFHTEIKIGDEIYKYKEGNGWGYNLAKIQRSHPMGLGCFEELYSARKAYGKGKSQLQAAMNVIVRNKPDDYSIMGYPVNLRLIEAIGIMNADEKKELVGLLGRMVQKYIPLIPKSNKKFLVRKETLEKLTNFASRDPTFNTTVKISDDPGAIIDLDSAQDIVFDAAMVAENPFIIPRRSELMSFAKSMNGSWGNSFTDSSHHYLNDFCNKWEIDAQFGPGGMLIRQNVFHKDQIRNEIDLLLQYKKIKAINEIRKTHAKI